ncbi:hypothetical protein PR048_010223 [Dryococelus australis]|uniref:Uncharacterized protein n=1 Tax=Dryococelus australis TaxID=614101 RepID=A0ABQ9I252_9NEOP|nr:hypothetical protein PR048_010223 [Dryococelus australis]
MKHDYSRGLSAFTTGIAKWDLCLQNIIQISLDIPKIYSRSVFQVCQINECDGERLMLVHVLFTLCKMLTRQPIKILAGKYTSFLDVSITISKTSLLDFLNTQITTSVVFPLIFCQIRWVENSAVLKRAIEMLQFLRKYFAAVEKRPPDSKNFSKMKSLLTEPSCCCQNLNSCCQFPCN